MRIAVASGKGGTGKTLIATNLAWSLAQAGREVLYVDADVEGPNGHLFLHPEITREWRYGPPLPYLTSETCSGCGACQEVCAYHAMITVGDKVLLFPERCHSCGGCLLACPERALAEKEHALGTLRRGRSGKVDYLGGELDVGVARATPLIEQVVAEIPTREVTIIDSPPGTSCATVAAVSSAEGEDTQPGGR